MMSNFETYLLGLYNNRHQAQSNPSQFAQIFILWEKIEGGYHSKQWYRRDPHNPYRERYHKIVEISETRVVVENYNLDWTKDSGCDMIFEYQGSEWHGKLIGNNCIVRENVRVKTEIYLSKTALRCRDQGYDPNGKMVFGSLGLYELIRGD